MHDNDSRDDHIPIQILIFMIMIMIIMINIILPISVKVSKGGKGKAKAAFGDPAISYVPPTELVLKIWYDHIRSYDDTKKNEDNIIL